MSQQQTFFNPANIPPGALTTIITDNGTVIVDGNVVHFNGGPGVQIIANPDGSNNLLANLTEVSPHYTNVDSSMSPYTVLDVDYFISVDCTGGPVVINLPDTTMDNRQFIIKDRLGASSTNNITIQSLTGGSTIDQQVDYVFVDNFESLECLYNSNNYEVF